MYIRGADLRRGQQRVRKSKFKAFPRFRRFRDIRGSERIQLCVGTHARSGGRVCVSFICPLQRRARRVMLMCALNP
eukprot:SAG11_NODE_102_length_16709_cov_31.066093_20_plen_76_part_00